MCLSHEVNPHYFTLKLVGAGSLLVVVPLTTMVPLDPLVVTLLPAGSAATMLEITTVLLPDANPEAMFR